MYNNFQRSVSLYLFMVPYYSCKKEKIHYFDFIKKVKDKMQVWKGKILSYEGKTVLITIVIFTEYPYPYFISYYPSQMCNKKLHKVFVRVLLE